MVVGSAHGGASQDGGQVASGQGVSGQGVGDNRNHAHAGHGPPANRQGRRKFNRPPHGGGKPRPAAPLRPLTTEMKEGKAPLRTFGDLKQFFEFQKEVTPPPPSEPNGPAN
jgi:hypothetical protein